MAHFAKLDDDNKVIQVHVVSNDALDSENEEESGVEFLVNWSGGHTNWKQTSYSGRVRFNFAGIGYLYDPIDDAFIPPMPECGHDELTLNEFKRWECANVAHELP
jgi:hypothetical protein